MNDNKDKTLGIEIAIIEKNGEKFFTADIEGKKVLFNALSSEFVFYTGNKTQTVDISFQKPLHDGGQDLASTTLQIRDTSQGGFESYFTLSAKTPRRLYTELDKKFRGMEALFSEDFDVGDTLTLNLEGQVLDDFNIQFFDSHIGENMTQDQILHLKQRAVETRNLVPF